MNGRPRVRQRATLIRNPRTRVARTAWMASFPRRYKPDLSSRNHRLQDYFKWPMKQQLRKSNDAQGNLRICY